MTPAGSRAAQFRAVVEQSPDALVIVDLDKRIVLANDTLLELFGYASEAELLVERRLTGRGPLEGGSCRRRRDQSQPRRS